MTQYSFGNTNPAAQGVPDLYINIQTPPAASLPGAPSTMAAFVGTATWGPVNSPVFFGDLAGGAAAFGTMQPRKYDLLTGVAAAVMQGANSFCGVRVTDGTDAAATIIVQSTCITLTAKYTGSRGNSLQATIATGSAPSSFKITLTLPGLPPETFDNITGSGNALWVAMAAAINSGQSVARGPSNLVVATAGAGTTAPTLATVTLSGGIDGATTITSTVLIGADTGTRTGMYALRGTGAAVFALNDNDTSTSWTTQLAFAKSELMECFAVDVANDTISTFTTTMTTAAIDDPYIKVCYGDWPLFVDGVNNVNRYISPQGYLMGAKVAAGPANSILNRPLYGVAGTQKSALNQTYSTADLQALAASRGEVIAAPSVGGAYFSARFGRNSSSDPGRHGDQFTTLTNYLARSMGQGLGAFVGRLLTPTEMREAQNAIGAFLENEKQAGRIQGYSVQVNAANNPSSLTNLGIQTATVMVQYFSVVEYFAVNFTGGQTVVPASAQPLAA